jgi:hypothetical protein
VGTSQCRHLVRRIVLDHYSSAVLYQRESLGIVDEHREQLETEAIEQVWDTSYMPITTSGLYDRFGQIYNITRIIGPNHQLNIEEYQSYSPIYISVTYAMTFTIAFALTTAAVVHTALHQGERIYKTVRSRKFEDEDIHIKHMRQYPEVPDWCV